MPAAFTIGHSNHPLERFVELLRGARIEVLADVRTAPRSRKWPHFDTEALATSLPAAGVRYVHLRGLGGFRRPRPDSPNGAWENESFRGYADYALTEPFEQALDQFKDLAGRARAAMMCSEALWWRCHRRLVSDRLVAEGWEVLHIGADGRTEAHVLADFAVAQEDGRVIYPGTPQLF